MDEAVTKTAALKASWTEAYGEKEKRDVEQLKVWEIEPVTVFEFFEKFLIETYCPRNRERSW